jgi:hypothetical protein
MGKIMKKAIIATLVTGTFVLASAGSALAGSDNHKTPGAPGEANCFGQTFAYAVQGNSSFGDGPGMGNIARHNLDLAKVTAEGFCAG